MKMSPVSSFQLTGIYLIAQVCTRILKDNKTKTKNEPKNPYHLYLDNLTKITTESLVSEHCSKEGQPEIHRSDSVTGSLQTPKGNKATDLDRALGI